MVHKIWSIRYGPYDMVHMIWSIWYGFYCMSCWRLNFLMRFAWFKQYQPFLKPPKSRWIWFKMKTIWSIHLFYIKCNSKLNLNSFSEIQSQRKTGSCSIVTRSHYFGNIWSNTVLHYFWKTSTVVPKAHCLMTATEGWFSHRVSICTKWVFFDGLLQELLSDKQSYWCVQFKNLTVYNSGAIWKIMSL